MDLEELRGRLAEVDEALIGCVARRQHLVDEIGKAKRGAGLATRDFAQEKEVLNQARSHATRLGVPPDVAEALMRHLIHVSLASQEQARLTATGHGWGRRALVIGGAGGMGRWFADFLASQGFDVDVADPADTVTGPGHLARWEDSPLDQDLVVVAAPLGVTPAILQGLAARRPRGLVFDVGSLKTPLRPGLLALVAAGCQVTSIHPMFGPETDLLSGRRVIFVDLGVPAATAEARRLFEPTMAIPIEMGIDDHDRMIGYVLGLSHAVNIAFFTALADSGIPARELALISSTTFEAQLGVSHRVARQNPHLSYDIQHLNEHGLAPLDALCRVVSDLAAHVRTGDAQGFVGLLERGREYLRDLGSQGDEVEP